MSDEADFPITSFGLKSLLHQERSYLELLPWVAPLVKMTVCASSPPLQSSFGLPV